MRIDAKICRGGCRAASVILVVLWSQSATAGEVDRGGTPNDIGWPQLRGPRYDGTSAETGLPDRWPTEGPPVLWSRDFGQGYSSFAVLGGRLYTQMQNLHSQYVVCLDAATGKEIWRHRYGLPYETAGIYPGPRATPTVSDGRVYFAGPDGLLGCLNAEDGQPIWSVDVHETFGGRGADFGYSASPVVIEGKVILPVGGPSACVVAFDAKAGAVVWRSGDQPASYCSVLPVTYRGRRHVVAFLQNALAGFDVPSGRLLWQHVYSQGYDEHAAAPLYQEPYLMVASPFRGGSIVYRIEGEDPSGETADVHARHVRDSKVMSNDVVSSVLVDGKVYGFDLKDVQAKAHRPSRGEFRCLDLISGEVHWSTEKVGHASVIAVDGKLVLFNDSGELILARATPERYEELSRTRIFGDEITWTAPALDRGRLYLRTHTRAACVYIGPPEGIAPEELAKSVSTSDVAAAGPADLTWMVGGEREHPFVPLRPDELKWWYVFELVGVFGTAIVVASVLWLPLRLLKRPGAGVAARTVIWLTAFAAGIVAGPGVNAFWARLREQQFVDSPHHFVFLWPASLYVAFQMTLIAVVWAERRPQSRKAWWVSSAAAVAFVIACGAYFYFCRTLSMMHEWVFLVGFVPAAPFAVLLARRSVGRRSLFWETLWGVLAFSAFFWGSAAFTYVKLALGDSGG